MWLWLAWLATAPGRYLPWSISWRPPALTRQCFADGEGKFPKLLHFCPCRSWPVGGWGECRIWMLMLRPGENREGDGLLLHVQVKTINWRKTREQAVHSCCCKLRQFPTGSHWKPAEGKIFSLEVRTAAKPGQAKPHVWWLRLGRWRRRRDRRLLRYVRGSGVWPNIPAAPSACRLEKLNKARWNSSKPVFHTKMPRKLTRNESLQENEGQEGKAHEFWYFHVIFLYTLTAVSWVSFFFATVRSQKNVLKLYC